MVEVRETSPSEQRPPCVGDILMNVRGENFQVVSEAKQIDETTWSVDVRAWSLVPQT